MENEVITNGNGTDLTVSEIQNQIYQLPNRPPFMLDLDLARLYESSTKQINQAVRRNPHRFPDDFCFRLTSAEMNFLKSQNGTSIPEMTLKSARGFTEMGANQLSGSLKTPVAAARSVAIMRAFQALRDWWQRGHSSEPSDAFREGFELGYRRALLLSELYEQHSIPRVTVAEYCHYRSKGYSLPAAAGACFIREKKARAIEEAFEKVGMVFPKRFIPPKPGEAEKSLMTALRAKATPSDHALLPMESAHE